MNKLLLTFIAILFAIQLNAQPNTITYQGVLTDNSGALITGTPNITFALYAASSGGSALWTETQNAVSVTNGLFQVELNSVTANWSNANFSGSMWLQITVGSTTLTPRIAFTAGGYSLAGKATSLQIASDAGAGKVLTSDADGNGAWTDYIGYEYVNPANTKGDIIYQTGTGTLDYAILGIGNSSEILTVDPITSLPKWIAPQWTTSGSDIYRSSGNVGIGTAAPAAQLHTTGSVRFAGAGTPGDGKVLTSDANGTATWATPSGGGGPTILRATSTGNSIVVTAPSYFIRKTFTVTGATIGDAVIVNLTNVPTPTSSNSYNAYGLSYYAWVSTDNTVTVHFQDAGCACTNLSSITVMLTVIKAPTP